MSPAWREEYKKIKKQSAKENILPKWNEGSGER
jgi:hypothetical protein